MKYPMFNNWLEFRQINKDEIEVIDSLSGAEYTMGIGLFRFARKLNGKRNPYKISRRYSRQDVKRMLDSLDKAELLRHNRVLTKGFGSIYYSILFPHVKQIQY